MPRNVVLICIDTVRKDVFDEVCSRISSLASVEFSKCRAPAPCTVPSHANMLTGQLSYQHGIHSSNVDFRLLESTFLDELPQYQRIGVSANPYFSSEFNADQHFDKFTNISPKRRYPDGLDAKQEFEKIDDGKSKLNKVGELFFRAARSDRPIQSLLNVTSYVTFEVAKRAPMRSPFDKGGQIVKKRVKEEVEEATEPFFVYANFMDAHGPLYVHRGLNSNLHDVPVSNYEGIKKELKNENPIPADKQEFVSKHREQYSASVEYLDRLVSNLSEKLLTMADNDTTIIVTADHGENLGYENENYLFGHRSSLSESLLHVPLVIINPPEDLNTGDRINKHFTQLDMGELIQSIGSETTLNWNQTTPKAELVGTPVDEVMKSKLTNEEIAYRNRMIRAVYDGNKKYVWDSESNKYQIDFESGEKSSIAEVPSHVKEEFDEEICNSKARLSELETASNRPSEATMDRLKELGYV